MSVDDVPGGWHRLAALRRVPVPVRLTAAVTLVCLVLITLGVAAVRHVADAQSRLEGIYRDDVQAGRHLDDTALAFSQMLYEVDNLVLADDAGSSRRALRQIKAANTKIDESWAAFAALPAAGTALERRTLTDALAEYRTIFRQQLLDFANDYQSDADTFTPLRERLVDPLSYRVQFSLNQLRTRVEADSRAALINARHAYAQSRAYTLALTLTSVLLALGLLAVSVRGLFALRVSRTLNRTDTLTGLANRLMLSEVLPQAADRAGQAGREVAVLLLDLDGFKQINDTLGHAAGDRVLRHFADTLRRSVRAGDTVVRQGGDEFAMIVEGLESATEAVVIAERIRTNLRPPLTISGQEVQVRASIGIAVHAFPNGSDGAAERELLHEADLAMYASKRAGTHSWQLYAGGGGMETDEDTVELREDLRRAVALDQIEVHYQPIVRLPDARLAGLEALVRWRHPTRGLIPPGIFVPMAEETGLIHDLGMTVLEKSCRQVMAWQAELPPGRSPYLAVNVSAPQLDRPELAAEILAALARIGFDPADLVVELTETALVDDAVALQHLHRLREQGTRIAIDDFGTGYSSISYLTRLPVDILKLDQSFVAKLNGQPEGSAVAEAVIRLGQALHLDTVAEGIETQAQVNELTLLGCTTAQGFYFSRPMPADEAGVHVLGGAARETTLVRESDDVPLA